MSSATSLSFDLTASTLTLSPAPRDPTFSLFDFNNEGSAFAPTSDASAAAPSTSSPELSWDVYRNFTWPQLDDIELGESRLVRSILHRADSLLLPPLTVDDMVETGWLQAQQAQQLQPK